MKKDKFHELIERLFNKILEKHGVDYNYIMAHQEINGVPWYDYYTMTQKEFDDFKLWAMPQFVKFFKNKKQAEREYAWFTLFTPTIKN